MDLPVLDDPRKLISTRLSLSILFAFSKKGKSFLYLSLTLEISPEITCKKNFQSSVKQDLLGDMVEQKISDVR